jgi:uncharacterized membrane protein YeiB
MPIQRKNLFLTWGIRISLVPVILVLLAGLSVVSGAGVSMAVSSVATVSSTSVLLSGVCKVLSVCCAQAQSNTVAKRMDNRHFFIL